MKAQKVEKIQHDGTISIATASTRTSTEWANKELTWGEFLHRISETVRTKETADEYRQMPKAKQDAIKDVGGFVGGRLKGGRRKADKVFNRSILTLDIDYGEEGMDEIIDMLFGHAYALYSTHKHLERSPRLRFIVPLARPVTAEEYVAIGKKVAEMIGIDYFDDTTYQAHRLMYWPSTSQDAPYFFYHQDTTWLEPDKILDMYDNWQDPLEWPVSSRQKRDVTKLANKQGDPHDKPGLVGAFCRTYTIQEAIEQFLSDKYEPYQDGRYTYVDGSTAGGLITYEDGKFAYSHHGTDPTSHQLVNSFDLVRLHMFHERDEDKSPETPVNKLPSYQEMIRFAQQDEGVKEQGARDRIQQATEDFDEIEVDEEAKTNVKWTKALTLNKQGEIESSVPNMVLILDNDPLLKGKFATNEFSRRLMVMGNVPWRKTKPDVFGDNDDSGLRDYFERYYGVYNRSKTEDAVRVISERHKFHPIRDYLDPLEWDGVERLDTLLVTFLGAEDTELTRAATRKAFTAAVARVYEPGCKFDYMLTLYGAQGIGKSMLLDRMGRQWFSDSLVSMTGKEAYEALQGSWIMELGELSATRKADVESIKHFISKREDRFRVAYGRHITDFPRQCVFFGTTNDEHFLKDHTGGRRFWPITVNQSRVQRVWSTLTDEEVDQLWAEAKKRYDDGEKLYLDERLESLMKVSQEAHTEQSALVGMIQEYLDTPLPENWKDMSLSERRMYLNEDDDFGVGIGTVEREKVCIMEIWCECLNNDRARFKQSDQRELTKLMKNIKGWKPNDSNPRGTLRFGNYYGVQRAYLRENEEDELI